MTSQQGSGAGRGRVLLHGVLAGLVAGLVAAVFFSIAVEPTLDRAIALEERAAGAHPGTEPAHDDEDAAPHSHPAPDGAGAAAHSHGAPETPAAAHHHGEETVSRETQKGVGLFLALALAGMTFGALIAAAFLVWGGRGTAYRRALLAGASLFGAITLVPWLKYPPNPPGVGRSATVGDRQALYLVLICCTVLLICAAVRLFRQLAARGMPEHVRIAAATAALVVPLGALMVWLPGSTDPVTLPASLVWEFRVRSLAGNALLWLSLTLAFGVLVARAGSRTARVWAIKEASA